MDQSPSTSRVQKILERTGSAFAMFGLTCGLGYAAWQGYTTGTSVFPGYFVWMVFVPTGIAQMLRAATFIVARRFLFFIAVDIFAAIVTSTLVAQHFGFFLRVQ